MVVEQQALEHEGKSTGILSLYNETSDTIQNDLMDARCGSRDDWTACRHPF
jgi:hypothetical protein